MPKISIPAGWCCAVCLFVMVAFTGLVADLLTKHWAFQALGMPEEYEAERSIYWVWQGVAGFQTTLNTGALFGLGAGKTTFLVVLSLIFLVGLFCYAVLVAWRSLFLSAVLGMITAGVCGNLYDRLGWHGLVHPNFFWQHGEWHLNPMAGEPIYAVRDWLLVMIGTFHWPNFNIADALLVCSVILLLLHNHLFEAEKRNTEKLPPAPAERDVP